MSKPLLYGTFGTPFFKQHNKMDCNIKYRDGGFKQWYCTCPPGHKMTNDTLEKLQNGVVTWDGCGPAQWGDGLFILNSILIPRDLQTCCNSHDVCYKTMYHDASGMTTLSEWEEKHKDFNQLDWGVCDDVFQTCNKSKVSEVPWYDIPGKAWISFVGSVLSSTVIGSSADFFNKLDKTGKLYWTNEFRCVKEGEGLCMYD